MVDPAVLFCVDKGGPVMFEVSLLLLDDRLGDKLRKNLTTFKCPFPDDVFDKVGVKALSVLVAVVWDARSDGV